MTKHSLAKYRRNGSKPGACETSCREHRYADVAAGGDQTVVVIIDGDAKVKINTDRSDVIMDECWWWETCSAKVYIIIRPDLLHRTKLRAPFIVSFSGSPERIPNAGTRPCNFQVEI